MSAGRPNVLFVICDDLNCALEGFGAEPAAHTPHLNRLRKHGVTFVNAHNNCPTCLPSRNSLFSGLYPHKTGNMTLWEDWEHCRRRYPGRDRDAWSNQALLPTSVWMHEHFKAEGYQCWGVGKTTHSEAFKREGWSDYGEGPNYGPLLFDSATGESIGHPRSRKMSEGPAACAFGQQQQGLDAYWLKDDRLRHPFELDFGALADFYSPYPGVDVWYNKRAGERYRYVSDDNRDRLPDERYTDWAIEKLQHSGEHSFFLAVGYMRPHTPMVVPQAFIDRYPLGEIELPAVLEGDLEDCARALKDHRPFGFALYKMVRDGGPDSLLRWVQAYLASITFMDAQLGRLLDALESSGQADNTLIVFTSDNGFHLGEKAFLFKDSLWEPSGRIPLVICAPGGCTGEICKRPVSLIDVYPTLTDFCGLDSQPHRQSHGHPLDGHSLKPLLGNADADWTGPSVALTSVRGQSGEHHSVRSERYRYTLCNNGEEEFYDHLGDPWEFHNLASDPEHAIQRNEHRAELLKLLNAA